MNLHPLVWLLIGILAFLAAVWLIGKGMYWLKPGRSDE